MKLTGKAKEEFEEWFDYHYTGYKEHLQIEVFMLAVILEWFDTVNYHIVLDVEYENEEDEAGYFTWKIFTVENCNNGDWFTKKESRNEATLNAIGVADQMYNENMK